MPTHRLPPGSFLTPPPPRGESSPSSQKGCWLAPSTIDGGGDLLPKERSIAGGPGDGGKKGSWLGWAPSPTPGCPLKERLRPSAHTLVPEIGRLNGSLSNGFLSNDHSQPPWGLRCKQPMSMVPKLLTPHENNIMRQKCWYEYNGFFWTHFIWVFLCPGAYSQSLPKRHKWLSLSQGSQKG